MGHRLIQQRRGRGTAIFRSPSHRSFGKIGYPVIEKMMNGEIVDLVNSRIHSAPLMMLEFENGEMSLLPAPIGVKVGQKVTAGENGETNSGNIVQLKNIPAGTSIYNVELRPRDGGKLIRTAGSSAFVVGKEGNKVILKLPSKKKVTVNPDCFATIGVIAGGGRLSKPLLKAGRAYHIHRAKNKRFPRVCGVAMNPPDHPHGGTHRRNMGHPTTIKRDSPPGQKVGLVAARRTGKKKK